MADLDMSEQINVFIRTKREEQGMTQSELARKIGVHRQVMYRIETEKQSLPFDLAVKIANALELGVEELAKFVSVEVETKSEKNQIGI